MADTSVSERIVAAIAERLEEISIANGYHTDAGAHVDLGLTFIGDADEVALSVISGDEDSEINSYPRVTNELQVHIDGHITHDGYDSDTRAQRLIADIKQAVLRQADRTLGGLCRSVDPFGRAVEYPDDGSNYVSVRVTVSVRYHDTYGAPWQAA